ncbi:MAG: thioredoxin family protein [Thermoanaerobaculia bacterium]
MKVEVLGPGCPKCKKLYENALVAKEKLNLEQIEVLKVEGLPRMMELGMWSVPGIAIDGKLVSQGIVHSPEELLQIFKNHFKEK